MKELLDVVPEVSVEFSDSRSDAILELLRGSVGFRQSLLDPLLH